MQRVNFDAVGGLPLSAAGRAALLAALDQGWADPRRVYYEARVARQLLDAARASVAATLGTHPDRVIFTAGGTQAVIAGMRGLARARAHVGSGVVATAVEHSAVLATADELCSGQPAVVGVDGEALVSLPDLAAALRSPGVALAAVQQVSAEVGSRQPVAAAHALAREAGVPLMVDARAGLPVLGPPPAWDVLVATSRLWGGPAGVGVLALAPGVRWRAPAQGAPDDGFANIPAIVAAAAALEAVASRRDSDLSQVSGLGDQIRAEAVAAGPDIRLLGPLQPEQRAGHIVALTVLYADGQMMVEHLDRAGFAVASGSACSSDTRRPSHVLAAMGAVTHGNLRISLPPGTTQEQVSAFLNAFPPAVRAAREGAGWDE